MPDPAKEPFSNVLFRDTSPPPDPDGALLPDCLAKLVLEATKEAKGANVPIRAWAAGKGAEDGARIPCQFKLKGVVEEGDLLINETTRGWLTVVGGE